MSWSVSTGQQRPQEIERAIKELEAPEDVASWNQDYGDQLEAAKKAAIAILRSGAVGDPKGENRDYIVTLSGHSNPGHAPRPGFANDTVTVTVSQLNPAVTYSR